MTAPKRYRWACPECGKGLLAPSRLRKIDARRYCLPCTKTTGLLVERVAPALESKRAAAQARQAEKAKRVRARESAAKRREREAEEARYTAGGFDVRPEADRLWEAFRKRDPRLPSRRPPIRMRRGTRARGAAVHRQTGWGSRIELTPSTDGVWGWTVLVHELAHEAIRSKPGDMHSREFYYAMRDVIEARSGIRVSFHKVSRWGYSVDYLILAQLTDAGYVPGKGRHRPA